jgi:WD40 repeat protein
MEGNTVGVYKHSLRQRWRTHQTVGYTKWKSKRDPDRSQRPRLLCVILYCDTKIVSGGGWPVARISRDVSIRIWDTETGAQIGSPLTVDLGVVFSPDDSKIVDVHLKKTRISIFDAQTRDTSKTSGPWSVLGYFD